VAEGRERVLVIALSDLTMTARIAREIEFLASKYDVVVAASAGGVPPEAAEVIELPPSRRGSLALRAEAACRVGLRLARRYRRAYWRESRLRRWLELLRASMPLSAIVVNDLSMLPLALAVADDVPVVFDAHEHWTSESVSWSRRQRLSMGGAHEWLVDDAVPRTAGLTTVSRGIARDYEQRTGLIAKLVTNAPISYDLAPAAVGNPIRLLHIGLADPRRRLEDTIEAVRGLDERFELDLLLALDNDYRRRLVEMVRSDMRIRILDPIPNRELIPTANKYDVGVFLLPGNFPNQVHVLPNKLFDYIQARLAVAIGPNGEMAEVVTEWDCGVVSPSFSVDDFARTLGDLTPDRIAQMKENADRAARVLNAEANRNTVLAVVDRAIASRRRS
jgi:hypothetical protein